MKGMGPSKELLLRSRYRTREVADVGWHAPIQTVVAEVEVDKVGEIREAGGDRAGESVAVQLKLGKVQKLPQGGRNAPAKQI